MKTKWVWVLESVVLAIHEEQLAEHGGGVGLRAEGLLASALARPQNRLAYGDAPDAPDAAALAAAYGSGLARNHPFMDGNKRTAFVVLELFLNLNGWELNADDTDCIATVMALADGSLKEDELAAWVRERISRS